MPQKARCKRLRSSLFVNPLMAVLTAVCQGLSERVHGHTRALCNNPRHWTDTLARPTFGSLALICWLRNRPPTPPYADVVRRAPPPPPRPSSLRQASPPISSPPSQGWQGRWVTLTSSPRPALPGKISAPRPRAPRASPGRTGLRPGRDPRVTRLTYFAQT